MEPGQHAREPVRQRQLLGNSGRQLPLAATLSAVNTAFITADHESPVADAATVSISCSAPPPQLAPSSLTKTADKASYNTGDNITYTINYTNINGSIADSTADGTILSSGTNWTLDSGTANTYAAGGITLPNGTGKSHYNYSSGINGVIYASVNMTNNSSNFGVYFRGTLAFTMQICGTGTSCPVTIWNGTTAAVTGNYSFNFLKCRHTHRPHRGHGQRVFKGQVGYKLERAAHAVLYYSPPDRRLCRHNQRHARRRQLVRVPDLCKMVHSPRYSL